MLLVDFMPTKDILKHVESCYPTQWADNNISDGPTTSTNASPASGAQHLSDFLDQLQYTAWKSPQQALNAVDCVSGAPDVSAGLLDVTHFSGTHPLPDVAPSTSTQGVTEAMLDAWEVSLLEELSKDDLANPASIPQSASPPVLVFNRSPPFKLAVSSPLAVIPLEEQQLAQASWMSFSTPQPALPPLNVPDQPTHVSAPNDPSPSLSMSFGRSGSNKESDSSAKTGKSRSKRPTAAGAGPRRAETMGARAAAKGARTEAGRGSRDEAARARNARNQQLHRLRQKEKLEVGERKCQELQDQIRHLTMLTAGLRAHNEALQAAEQERLMPGVAASDQGLPGDALWQMPGSSLLTSEVHAKLAAVLDCITQGMGKGPVNAADVAMMSPEDIFLARQQYGIYLGQLLSSGAHDEASQGHARLVRVVTLWAASEECLWRQCPKTVHRFAAFAQQQEKEGQAPTPAALKWSTILGRLGLSERQKAQLKEANQRLADQLLNVAAERFHVSAMLKETCPNAHKGNTWEGSATYLRVLEAHRRLAASIRHEHDHMLSAHLAFRQILSPLQQALCDVMAHPGCPDVIAIFNVLGGGYPHRSHLKRQ